MKEGIIISHQSKMVALSNTDIETKDVYNYYFLLENGIIKLHSIDIFRKSGKSGVTYKLEELFHHEHKKKITNYETGDFEEPKIPEEIIQDITYLFKGYILFNL